MSARPHIEALIRSSEALADAIEQRDFGRVAAIVDERLAAIDALKSRGKPLGAAERAALGLVLEQHADHAARVTSERDSVASELQRIRQGRSVARAHLKKSPPTERFVSERC